MTRTMLDAARIEALVDDLAESLGRALQRAHYGPEILGRAEGIAPRRFDAVRLPLVLEFLRATDGPAAVAARLFSYRDAVRPDEVASWLPTTVVSALREAGLLVENECGLNSRVRVLPFDNMLLAADEADAGADPVMPPGATTAELACALPDSLEGTMLDVGCGCGALALGAARRGASATGVDIDPRAIAWSRFNARLNGIDAKFECSDLFAAIGSDRFDLIVSQPPFVPCPEPEAATTYLHGGNRGDEFAFRMLSELAPHITDNGRALLLFDAPTDTKPLWERIRSALADEGLDLAVVAAPGHTAEQASIGYAAAAHPTLGPAYRDAAIAYRRHLRQVGVDRVLHALVVLTRRTDPLPRYSVTLNPPSLAEYDNQGLSELDRSLRIASEPDDELTARTIAAAPGAVLIQKDSLRDSETARLEVEFRHGRGQAAAVSDAAAVLLQLSRQPQPIEALMRAFADAADATPTDVRGAVLTFVRDGLVRGLLCVPS